MKAIVVGVGHEIRRTASKLKNTATQQILAPTKFFEVSIFQEPLCWNAKFGDSSINLFPKDRTAIIWQLTIFHQFRVLGIAVTPVIR
jgi:hypothetical protein